MTNTLPAMLDRLQSVVEQLDPNIGRVHQVQGRWSTEQELVAGGQITVDATGLLDGAEQVGQRRVRFWTLEAHSEPEPLTTGSQQYRHAAVLRAFYAAPQEMELRTAALALVDRLNEAAVEEVELRTGIGYLGYLQERPKMNGPVRNARIGDEGTAVSGHTVEISVTLFEEVED